MQVIPKAAAKKCITLILMRGQYSMVRVEYRRRSECLTAQLQRK
jgi:hypothetical protein